MDSAGVIVLVLAFAAVGITFYLRKNLEEHRLHLWVYAGVPLTAITSIIFVLYKEYPTQLMDSLFYSIGTVTMGVFFIGALIALLDKRKEDRHA